MPPHNLRPWFPDMNPFDCVWDFIGRKVNQRNPQCQNIAELTTQFWKNGGDSHKRDFVT